MVGMVVVGHGRLAAEMVRSLESVLGRIEALASVTTATGDTAEEVRARIEAAVRRVDRGEGVIILTDMLGDTATNQSLVIARDRHIEVIAGVNMPMLIKLTTVRAEMDARTLARFLLRYGRDHIFWATEPTVRARHAR
jgi:PTS system mannose-specific IIA component